MSDIIKELQKKIRREQIFENELMSKHTSFKIGGPADYFVKATNLNDIKHVLNISEKYKLPLTIVGNGTNLLVSDKGVRGIVLKLDLLDFKYRSGILIRNTRNCWWSN